MIGKNDTLRQEDPPNAGKIHFVTIISPIYFVVFVLLAQFVLLNIVVADSNKVIGDDAEMYEEIEQQLESDVHNENYAEQSLLDVNTVHVEDKVKIKMF
ncbi:unnamed protein product [Rotaria sp. Silwood2]|nr:unnamed protein product [Rotaria sp. Silwood2]CAF2817049.1 unnamed protein product [Rotaria sp. Silwood2]CAF3111152.1 unnamed protein product [Rotaria sp. Silwood2]CAF3240119.1 unnamed protein product [Rotaria sp. Silwood2]CAF3950134.1 unnamed protein product [Rotaria sp. Silwood2]